MSTIFNFYLNRFAHIIVVFFQVFGKIRIDFTLLKPFPRLTVTASTFLTPRLRRSASSALGPWPPQRKSPQVTSCEGRSVKAQKAEQVASKGGRYSWKSKKWFCWFLLLVLLIVYDFFVFWFVEQQKGSTTFVCKEKEVQCDSHIMW